MKQLSFLLLLISVFSLKSQVLEVPTLQSKGILDKVTTVEVNQYEFVADKGLSLSQSDIETYDANSKLISIDRKILSTGQGYKYTYNLSKKGVLQEEKIINAANNETVRTTSYTYKRGLLITTTQVQGTVTFVKNYSYDKNGHLIKIEAIENGEAKGEEIYEVDAQGRQTKKSQKLPNDEMAKTLSTFAYTIEGNLEIKTETRDVNGVSYEIVATKNIDNDRNLKETTKNLSNSESGFNNLSYVDDEKGSWVKGEVIDNQFGRSRLILKRINYADGVTTGRIEMTPEDDLARYYRQNSKFQVIINGKIVTTGSAMDILDSKDRLAYSAAHNAWVLMKGYDAEVYQTAWHEGQIVTNTKDDVIWAHNSTGIDMYQNGKKLKSSAESTSGDYSEYATADTRLVYFGGGIKRSMVVKGIDKTTDLGRVKVADLTEEHNYWVKSSDTTYVAVGYGKYLYLRGQAEDGNGNNLVTVRVGDGSYFYLLPKFREGFDNSQPGDVFPSIYLTEPLKELSENKLYGADFSSFKYDNLKNRQYRLKSADGLSVHGLAMPTVKTSDDQLILYFPLTKQYLRMDNYYTLPDDKDILDQSVSVLLDNSKDAYYLYDDAKSIVFYNVGEKMGTHEFGSHKLDPNASTYGAVVYDSAAKTSYGMNYDLSKGDGMGPMSRLPVNQSGVYLLKLEGARWVVFQRGGKLGNYDYTTISEGNAYYFFKNAGTDNIAAFKFEGYKAAKPGDFISGITFTGKKAEELSVELKVNPLKPIEKEETPKGKPNSFKRDSTSYYLWDANGEPVVDYLKWFGNLGTQDAFTQDTTKRVTYKLVDYFKGDFIEGQAIPVAGPDDDMVIKWGENSITFLLSGRLKNNVKRVYVKNSPDASEWSELVYDPSTQQTYFMRYPTAEGFYLGKGELLPTGKEAIVLTKLNDGKFSIVRQGQLDRNETFKSDIYEGDLIYWLEGQGSAFEGYRFRGFEKGLRFDLFYPEVLTADQLAEIKSK